MGIQQGLSGLSASAKALDIVGNNIANASTVGFKAGSGRFASVYAAASKSAAGLGVRVSSNYTNYGQGNFTATANPLDVAISGSGFFLVNDKGVDAYTRDGQMQIDKDGYLVNSTGSRYRGFALSQTGSSIDTSLLTEIKLTFNEQPPMATSKASMQLNLESEAVEKPLANFNQYDPDTYNSATSMTIYDSLGAENVSTLFFNKVGTNQYAVTVSVNDSPAQTVGTVIFNGDGTVDQTASGMPYQIDYTPSDGATDPASFKLDFNNATQFGANFSVNSLDQDGMPPSRLIDFNIAENGVIYGRYTNGSSSKLAQLGLANFRSTQGLQAVGNNLWLQTGESGPPVVALPGASGTGTLLSGTVEDSNVDLTAELVNLINHQRMYQANSQTIKTQDQVVQTMLNIR